MEQNSGYFASSHAIKVTHPSLSFSTADEQNKEVAQDAEEETQ